MTFAFAVPLVIACLFSEGFFSGSEIAVLSADRLRLATRAEEGSRGAAMALQMLERPARLISVCLIGTNVSTVSAATVATAAFAQAWGSGAEALAVAALFPFILLFGELLPKSIFQRHASALAPWVIYPLRAFSILFSPLLFLISGFARAINGLADNPPTDHAASRQEIQSLLDSGDEVDLDEDDRELIQRVFDFREATVEDVMKPLIEVVSVPDDRTAREAIDIMVRHGHSRLPTYTGRVDQVSGMVFHQDLLFLEDLDTPLRNIKRPATFVPESKAISQLFAEFRTSRMRIAVPVDEYGGAVGLITMEDILEEIVGEIEDEHDVRTPAIRKVGEDIWLVAGRVEHEALEEAIGFEMPEGDYDTLAGYLLVQLGHIPRAGERVLQGEWVLSVSKASDRAIQEVRVKRSPPRKPSH